MLDLLNNYSSLIVALILGLFTLYQKVKEKREKAEHNQIINTIMEENDRKAEKQRMKEDLERIEKENLNKSLVNLNDAVGKMDQKITGMNNEFKKMKGEFCDFKSETKNKFTAINDNGLLTMQYTRGIASVTMDVLKGLNDCPETAALYQRFHDLCESQDTRMIETMFKIPKN